MKLKKGETKPKTTETPELPDNATENIDLEELAPEIESEPKGRGRPPKPEAFEYIRKLAARDFSGPEAHQIYLWRVDPQTARKKNTPDYLDCLMETIDQQRVKERFGGGVFQMRIMRGDKMIYDRSETTFTIVGPAKLQSFELPITPATPPAAVTAQSDHTMGILENLIDDLRNQRNQAQEEGRTIDIRDAVKQSLTTMGDASKAAIEIVRSQAGTEDKGSQSVLLLVVEKLLAGVGEKKESKLESVLMDRLIDKAFGENPATKDPWESFDNMVSRYEKMRGLGGVGTGSGKTNWIDVGMALVNGLPAIFEHGANVLAGAVELKKAGMSASDAATPVGSSSTAQNQQQPRVRPVSQMPAVAAATPATVPDATPVNGDATPQPMRRLTADEVRVSGQLRLKEVIVEKFMNGPQDQDAFAGEEAALVAEAFDAEFALMLVDKFKAAAVGDSNVIAEFRSDPVLSVLFTDPNIKLPELMTFAQEYIGYFEPEPAASVPVEPATAAVP